MLFLIHFLFRLYVYKNSLCIFSRNVHYGCHNFSFFESELCHVINFLSHFDRYYLNFSPTACGNNISCVQNRFVYSAQRILVINSQWQGMQSLLHRIKIFKCPRLMDKKYVESASPAPSNMFCLQN